MIGRVYGGYFFSKNALHSLLLTTRLDEVDNRFMIRHFCPTHPPLTPPQRGVGQKYLIINPLSTSSNRTLKKNFTFFFNSEYRQISIEKKSLFISTIRSHDLSGVEYASCGGSAGGFGGFAADFTKKASHRPCFRLLERLKKLCRNCDFYFFGLIPKRLQTFKPIRGLADNFNSNRVIGIYMIYNIYIYIY